MKLVTVAMMLGVVRCEDASAGLVVEPINAVDNVDNGLANTDLLQAFVVFRHGDRTPDQDELNLYPTPHDNNTNIFFPYGMKALTNKGKQRSYRVGEYLRRRYIGLISKLYIPDEVTIRTTNFDRTKMTALAALAALYPPPPAQRWNPTLDWQPVPYDTMPFNDDDLMYWYNCPRYLYLRDQIYQLTEVKNWLKPYHGLFNYLTEKTGNNITTSEDVFFLDNLFQTLENVKLRPPQWAQEVMPKIQEVTKIEYMCELYNSELVKLSSGILMADIINATSATIAGDTDQPKLYLYSAHENNVAGLMAAARVFQSHQPKYGATFSLELRKRRLTGQYGITAVYYTPDSGPSQVLPIAGCGGLPLCDYDTFLTLTQDVVWTRDQYKSECSVVSPPKGLAIKRLSSNNN